MPRKPFKILLPWISLIMIILAKHVEILCCWKCGLGRGGGHGEDISFIMESRILLGEGNGTPLQYSCLENPMDEGAWWAAVHGVAKSRTRLSDFTFSFHFHALEKEMATHSSVLAWRIPGTGEPGGLSSMGSHRVGHDWSNRSSSSRGCIWTLK